jgi:hypothetical protein
MCAETSDRRWLLKGIDYDDMPVCTVDLEPAWMRIWDQYTELSQDRDYQIYMDTVKRLLKIQNKYELLKAKTLSLFFRVNESYLSDLDDEGILLDFSGENEYIESLNRALGRIEQYDTKIKLLTLEIETKQKSGGGIKWENLVDSVEQHRGQSLNVDVLSIKRFVMMLNKIKEDGKRKN